MKTATQVNEDLYERSQQLFSLVDGAYEIVELFQPQSPSQEQWKKNWLKKARELGASTY